jgi:hypothetical protein
MTTPTQVQHPNRAALRTFLQAWVPLLALALVVVPIIVDIILDEAGKAGVDIPPGLRLILVGIATAAALISAVISRIMAIPAVEQLLQRLGLGAEPRSEALAAAEVDETPPPDDYEPRH